MPIDDGFPDLWPGPQPTPMWDYENRIPEDIQRLLEWVEVLKAVDHKKVDHKKAAREEQRGGVYRMAEVEKALWGIHGAAAHILEMIRVVDGFPKERPFIRYIETE